MTRKGFEVVPRSLRSTQTAYQDAAHRYRQFLTNDIGDLIMNEEDLGLIGQMAGVVSDYNKSVTRIADKSAMSLNSLMSAANSLDIAAKAYEAQDEEYYAKFGWVAGKFEDNGGVYQPDSKGGH